MHEGCCEDALARTVAKVHEGAACHVEGIVPAVCVFVFPGALDPLKNFEEGVELNLAIRQLLTFQVSLGSLPPALQLLRQR